MMLDGLERWMFMKDAPRRVHYVGPLDYKNIDELTSKVIEQMVRDFAATPPITMHISRPRIMAAIWTVGRESLVAGPLSRSRREAVAASVARLNECPFCVDVHTGMVRGAGEGKVANAILKGNSGVAGKAGHWEPLLQWASSTLRPSAEMVHSPPFSYEDAPQLIGSAVAFHYINRMVNVFLDDSPLPLPAGLERLRGAAGRVASRTLLKRIVDKSVSPGEFLLEVEGATLAPEFGWAKANPEVAKAFAIFSAVMEKESGDSLGDDVRDLVERHVNAWNGEEMPMNSEWLDDAISPVRLESRAGAKLALLTALASYRVTDQVIAEFRQSRPTNADLISATSWAAYTVTKRISSWLRAPESMHAQPVPARREGGHA